MRSFGVVLSVEMLNGYMVTERLEPLIYMIYII